MDAVYKPIHDKILRAASGCEVEHGLYSTGSVEGDWSAEQAKKYEVVLALLKAAVLAGEILFGEPR
jgi:hypothetical protein